MQTQPTQNNDAVELSPTSFRLDRNIIRDISNFNSQIDSDERLVRNIVYSVAEDFEHSLFGFGTLDPAVFAKKWKYDTSYLRKRVDEPYQLRNLSPEAVAEYRRRLAAPREDRPAEGPDERVWDTHLENALYILSNKPFNFDAYKQFVVTDAKTLKEKDVVKVHASFTLFTSITAVQVGRGKVVYTYTINENFERSLTRFYIRGERESLLRLRPSGLDPLYLYLSNVKVNLAVHGQHRTTPLDGGPSFDDLCNVAGIPAFTKDGARYEAKKRKQLLMDAVRRVQEQTELAFTLEWRTADGNKAAYSPLLDFGSEKADRYNNQSLGRMYTQLENFAIQRQAIQREMLSMYKKLFPTVFFGAAEEAAFNEWALDRDRNAKEKETALRLAFISIFHRIPDNIAELNGAVNDVIQKYKEPQFCDRMEHLRLFRVNGVLETGDAGIQNSSEV